MSIYPVCLSPPAARAQRPRARGGRAWAVEDSLVNVLTSDQLVDHDEGAMRILQANGRWRDRESQDALRSLSRLRRVAVRKRLDFPGHSDLRPPRNCCPRPLRRQPSDYPRCNLPELP
eukprot:5824482-Pyramimonas_sp.AAC.1